MIRFSTTIALAAAALAAVWYLPHQWLRLLILFIIGLGLWEYAKLVFQHRGTRILTLCLGLFVASSFPEALGFQIIFLLVASIFIAFLWEMKYMEPMGEVIHRVGLIILGICYFGLTLPFWFLIHQEGREWVMLLLFPTCLTDTFGFLAGKAFGKHKLAPLVSPNKTWEGFFAGLAGGGIFGFWLALQLFFKDRMVVDWPGIILFGLGISLVAVFGDLIESLIKRSVGVKDSSHLIPGHGGVMDRLDALIFTAPLFYFTLKLFETR